MQHRRRPLRIVSEAETTGEAAFHPAKTGTYDVALAHVFQWAGPC